MANFMEKNNKDYYGSDERKKFKFNKNRNRKNPELYLNPLLAIDNTAIRIVYVVFEHFCKTCALGNVVINKEKMLRLLAHIAGIAGTGKSFVMEIIKLANLAN